MTDSLFWLTLTIAMTAVFFLPYILEFISRVGLLPALSLAPIDPNKQSATPEWAERAKKAHYNAVENLVIFAPLVLIAHSADVAIGLAVQGYFCARLLHYVFYTAGVGLLRTLSFFGGLTATAYIVLALLGGT